MKISREELVLKLGIQDSTPEAQDEIIAMAIEAIDARIMADITSKLNEEDAEHLNQLIDQNDESGVEWFIKSKYDHYDNFVEQTERKLLEEWEHNIKEMTVAYKDPTKTPSVKLDL